MASEMSAKLDPELLGQIDELRDGKIRQVAPDEIVRVVQNIIDGMNSNIPSLELAVREDRRRKRAAQREEAEENPPGELNDRVLLRGPQPPEDAIRQDDIDALFTSMD